MKKIINIVVLFSLFTGFYACEKDLKPYDKKGEDRLHFLYEPFVDSTTYYTFVYEGGDVLRDTLWIPVGSMGFSADYQRDISVEAVPAGENTAVVGKHFVAFDSKEVTDLCFMPANQAKTEIPVILLRDETLAEREYTLKIRVVENDYFKPGIQNSIEKTIIIADILTKPTYWNFYAEYYFAGKYGKVKHQFMIDATVDMGIKMNDEGFFYDLVGDPYNVDMGRTDYWFLFFSNKLKEENDRRAAQELGPLREEPTATNPEGEIVRFTQYER